MKRNALFAIALAACAAALSAQSADEIVAASRSRIDSVTATISSRSRMTIVAKDGGQTERLVDQYTLEGKEGDHKDGKRSVVVFQKPASVAGTRFLTVANAGRDDNRWIFLPSLGKVRRIATSEGSGSFVGTDFSYDDLSSGDRGVDEDTHAILREENVGDKACWVVESTPKDKSYQYVKTIEWIEKTSHIVLKSEMYDKKGLLKTLEFSQFKEVQGRVTPFATKLSNVQDKTATIVQIDILKYDEKIPEGVFTTRFLETGRL
jgi:outer membrane lipoprotein-sorting protein